MPRSRCLRCADSGFYASMLVGRAICKLYSSAAGNSIFAAFVVLSRFQIRKGEVVQLRQSSDHASARTRSAFGPKPDGSTMLCYNLHAGHGQMLRVVGLALGTGWGVLPYSFLSIKPRNSVIWGGNG